MNLPRGFFEEDKHVQCNSVSSIRRGHGTDGIYPQAFLYCRDDRRLNKSVGSTTGQWCGDRATNESRDERVQLICLQCTCVNQSGIIYIYPVHI